MMDASVVDNQQVQLSNLIKFSRIKWSVGLFVTISKSRTHYCKYETNEKSK